MITIKLNDKKKSSEKSILPIDLYGKPYGNIYQMYHNGEKKKDFFICCGGHEYPVHFWYDDEDNTLKISSTDKEGLKGYVEGITVRKINAKINVDITIN